MEFDIVELSINLVKEVGHERGAFCRFLPWPIVGFLRCTKIV